MLESAQTRYEARNFRRENQQFKEEVHIHNRETKFMTIKNHLTLICMLVGTGRPTCPKKILEFGVPLLGPQIHSVDCEKKHSPTKQIHKGDLGAV